jgi:hypothetical protein
MRTYRDFLWRSSRLIKRSFHHRLWRLPYTEVLVCHKQWVEVFHSNLSIERSWVPFRCWVSLFLTGFTSLSFLVPSPPSNALSRILHRANHLLHLATRLLHHVAYWNFLGSLMILSYPQLFTPINMTLTTLKPQFRFPLVLKP